MNIDITRSFCYYRPVQGEVSERFKEPVLKTGDAERHRGFESHPLRHKSTINFRDIDLKFRLRAIIFRGGGDFYGRARKVAHIDNRRFATPA